LISASAITDLGGVSRKRVAALLAGLLVALLVLEGVVRLRQWKRYGTTVTTYYRFAEDPATGLRIPEPGYTVGPITVNSLGFRGPEIERPKPPHRVRIAFLGGSTTFCAEASSLAATWPERVLAGLRAEAPDLEFDYVNGSAGGFTTHESLINLERRVGPLEPDVIVYYEATNDLTRDSRRAAIEQGLYEAEESDHSRIGDWWLTFYLVEKNVRGYLRTRHGHGGRLVFDPDALAQGFHERLAALVRAAQSRCPVVVLVTFSTKLRAGQDPETLGRNAASARFYMPFLDPAGLLEGYAAFNRVIRAVARETGAILVEGEDSIPGDDEHFADSVHLRDPGLALQAERVLAGLTSAPAYRDLLSAKRSTVR